MQEVIMFVLLALLFAVMLAGAFYLGMRYNASHLESRPVEKPKEIDNYVDRQGYYSYKTALNNEHGVED